LAFYLWVKRDMAMAAAELACWEKKKECKREFSRIFIVPRNAGDSKVLELKI
jgi:hypothetical protein